MGSDLRQTTRRDFVRTAAGTGAGLLLVGCGAAPPARPPVIAQASVPSEPAAEGSPAEALMREHGVLARVLLVYDEAVRVLEARRSAVDAVAGGAALVRRFIEDHHQKLEEKHVFPRFEKAGRWVQLVTTLRRQHQAGRWLTDQVLRLATRAHMRGVGNRRRLAQSVRLFVAMHRAHTVREDTVLFPALRRLVGRSEYEELAHALDAEEQAFLGAYAFDRAVEEVAGLERALGIHDLARFMPG